jgi:hypothetical protein
VLAPGQLGEHPHGVGLVRRLTEDAAVDVHLGVACEDEIALDGPRLAAGVLEHDIVRVAFGQLLDRGRAHVELDPELLEDRLSLRRRARED